MSRPMPQPVVRPAFEAFTACPERTVVALDFDGTLADITDRPDEARIRPGGIDVLRHLAAQGAGLVIVTGRPAADAVARAGFAGVPGLERLTVLGLYGAQRWDAATGRLTVTPPAPGIAAARAELPGILAGAPGRATVEDKQASLAVHTRGAPDPAHLLRALRGPLTRLADRQGLLLEPGRNVWELRSPGVDKGVALGRLLDERATAAVLYAGDDRGDLAAFRELTRRRAGGLPATLVYSAPAAADEQVAELRESADEVVGGPEGVLALLARLADEMAASRQAE